MMTTRRKFAVTAALVLMTSQAFAQEPPNPGPLPPPVCEVKEPPPFDLGAHGLAFTVRGRVDLGCDRLLIVYEPTIRAAALVDPWTGLAQVIWPFSADIPDGPRGPIVFDGVEQLAGRTLLWSHRGAVWSHRWTGAGSILFDLGALEVGGVRLFRRR